MAQPLTRCKGPYKLDKRKLVQGESGWSIYADLHTEYYDIHICQSDVLYKMEVNNVNIRQWSPDFFLYGVYLNRALLVKYNTAFYSMSWACVLSYLPFFYLFLPFFWPFWPIHIMIKYLENKQSFIFFQPYNRVYMSEWVRLDLGVYASSFMLIKGLKKGSLHETDNGRT